MRAVVQRVASAEVRVAGEVQGRIGPGLCVLVGVARGDGEEAAARLAGKIARLRVFEDEAGRFDRSLLDVGGAALVVSQFTLARRYSAEGQSARASPKRRRPRRRSRSYERFVEELRALGVPVETGVFGARMEVELVNDGPVTIVLDV